VKVIKQRNRYFKMMGRALVENNLAVEAELSCSLVDRP